MPAAPRFGHGVSPMAKGRGVDKKGRSKSMAPFVALDRGMMRSAAYRACSNLEKAVLVAVAYGHNGHNNGRIAFGARDGEPWGIGKPAAVSVALNALVKAGLLQRIQPGSFHGKRLRAEFMLTWRPSNVPGVTSTKIYPEKKASSPQRTHSSPQETVEPETRNLRSA